MPKESPTRTFNTENNIATMDRETLEKVIGITESGTRGTIDVIRIKHPTLAEGLEQDLNTRKAQIARVLEQEQAGTPPPPNLLETMYRNLILAMESMESNEISLRDWGNRRDTMGGIEPFPAGYEHLSEHYFPGRKKK